MRSSSPSPEGFPSSAPGRNPATPRLGFPECTWCQFAHFDRELASEVADDRLTAFRRLGRNPEDDLEPACHVRNGHGQFYGHAWHPPSACLRWLSAPHSHPLCRRPRRGVLGISLRNSALALPLVPWRAPNDAEVGPHRRSVAAASDGARSLAREVGGGLRRRPHDRQQDRTQAAVAVAVEGRSAPGRDERDVG
jgi:hypothetical protein